MKDNTLSALEVARLVSSFSNLHRFIQISTAYANAFLPDQEISECIYPFYDPESELATILETGTSPHAKRFPYPYAHSKHLSEQLLFSRFPDLPVLVVRPSCVGSAVRKKGVGIGSGDLDKPVKVGEGRNETSDFES